MVNIKGITIQLGADTTKLTDALRKVNSEIRNTQSDLREVSKLLKFDGGNSDLLVQQQKSLASAIEATKEKLKQEQEALKQLQSGEQNSNTIKQQEALTREIEKTKQSLTNLESQYKSFGSVDIQKHEAAVKKLNTQLSETKDRLKTVNEALKLDPGNTELLAEKQKLLADAIQQTKDKHIDTAVTIRNEVPEDEEICYINDLTFYIQCIGSGSVTVSNLQMEFAELFQKLGEWDENDARVPNPGDIIFYDWQDSGSGNNTGNPDHVGIVEKVDAAPSL